MLLDPVERRVNRPWIRCVRPRERMGVCVGREGGDCFLECLRGAGEEGEAVCFGECFSVNREDGGGLGWSLFGKGEEEEEEEMGCTLFPRRCRDRPREVWCVRVSIQCLGGFL